MSVAITDPDSTHLEGTLLKGRRGLVMGVANDHSIAWGIARLAASHGADLAFSYQNDAFRKRLEPLADSVGSSHLIQCDVSDPTAIEQTFNQLSNVWSDLDFVVHAVAYSDKAELSGRYVDTSLSNFQQTMAISCYSFTAVARAAEKMMVNGGSLVTMTYLGAERVMPNYNVMGVAKAALESSVRYLANDLGPNGIRVNAISPGPMKTLAGAAIGGARKTFKTTEANAPLRSNATLDAVGGTAVYLCSDHGAYTTGEIIRVDGGYHVLGMMQEENL